MDGRNQPTCSRAWRLKLLRRPGAACALLALLPAFPAQAAAALPGVTPSSGSITLVFRFDDISARSDLFLEERILRAFAARRLPLTVSVIPMIASRSVYDPSPQPGSPLPEEQIRLLRKALLAGEVEAALHGYAHQTVRAKLWDRAARLAGSHSEFAGVDPLAQRRILERGRARLESALATRVATFVPPWNGYDAGTVKALEEAGFRILSADRRGPAPAGSRLVYLPRTCGLEEVPTAVEEARGRTGEDPVIVALFHASDFVEAGGDGTFTLSRLGRLLDWITSQGDVQVLTVGGAARASSDRGVRRFRANRSALLWKLVPSWPDRFLPWPPPWRGVYLAELAARRAGRQLAWIALGMLGGALLAAALAFRAALGISSRRGRRPVIYFRRRRRTRGSCARLSHGMD